LQRFAEQHVNRPEAIASALQELIQALAAPRDVLQGLEIQSTFRNVLSSYTAQTACQPARVPSHAHNQWALHLHHACSAIGCSNMQCQLCRNDAERACTRTLRVKYLVKDSIQPKCGAGLEVHVVSQADNRLAEAHELPQFQLQVRLLTPNGVR
jgi:hypothetical protein